MLPLTEPRVFAHDVHTLGLATDEALAEILDRNSARDVLMDGIDLQNGIWRATSWSGGSPNTTPAIPLFPSKRPNAAARYSSRVRWRMTVP